MDAYRVPRSSPAKYPYISKGSPQPGVDTSGISPPACRCGEENLELRVRRFENLDLRAESRGGHLKIREYDLSLNLQRNLSYISINNAYYSFLGGGQSCQANQLFTNG